MKKFGSIILSAALALSMAVPSFASDVATTKGKVPEGFVYTEGTKFMMDDQPYYYAGTNNYYLNFKQPEEVDNVIEDAADMGLKVIRTWGHLDVGVPTGQVNDKGYAVFTDNADGSGEKEGIYYQYFDKAQNKPVVNTGEDGLQKLDYALYKAAQEDVKLLITFTNNWEAFGGMAQYVRWAKLAGENVNNHDDFYTNDTIKEWYKNYVNTLLNHTNVYTGVKYKDDPTVFAWELANEPRANSDAQCEENILAEWADEMSTYVKSIDPNHMVALGDEGFYNYGYHDFPEGEYKYVYYGCEGADFKQHINLENIDFGTVHIYCDQWGLTSDQAKFWFKQHGIDANAANKPVILEEFGWKERSTRTNIYKDWFKVLEGETYSGIEYAGTNYWMLASIMNDGKLYQDYDGYTVYYRADASGNPTQDAADAIMQHAKNMTAKNGAVVDKDNDAKITPSSASFDKAQGKDVAVDITYNNNSLVAIQNGTETLTKDVDYTLVDNKVTIKADYLGKLEKGTANLVFSFTSGRNQTLTVVVTDSSVVEKEEPYIDVTTATVDLASVEDILLTLVTNGNTLKGIKVGNETLVSGQDYAINGNQVRLEKSYLETLKAGQVKVVFEFEGTTSPVLTLTVKDSSESPVVSSDFVTAEGTQFYLDGKPFYFAGANAYDLFTIGDSSNAATIEDICTKYMYPDQIEARIKEMADNGVKVIRTWGFSNETWHGFEPKPGEYVEPQFMLFDYIMYCAQKYDVKVIITLENYWEAYGGIDKKLSWAGLSGGSHKSRAQYFTNETCKQYYKNYAEHFINRTNYFTGVQYKDDPTIFAWDLMNEPRYQDVSEAESTQGTTLRAWVDEMAGYIKSLDPNHMVCVGIEGHGTNYGFGGDEGNPFIYIQQSPYIDFCSAHPYPDEYWADLTPEENAELMRMWINDAHNEVGKPFVVGEFNVHSSLPYDTYEAYWRSVFDVIDEENAAGGLFWEFNTRQLSHFTILATDPILSYFKEHSAAMAAKNIGDGPVVKNAQILTKEINVDTDNVAAQEIKFNFNNNTLTAVKENDTIVPANAYTVGTSSVTLSKEYLEGLAVGKHQLTFTFNAGADCKLTITVVKKVDDKEAPTAPQGVEAVKVKDSYINLQWQASTDNVGVEKYNVYVDGTLNGTTEETTYTVSGLNPETSYTITVAAIDLAGNVSELSEAVVVTTSAKQEGETLYAYPWKKGMIYTGGEVVYYEGNYYKAQWYNVNTEPGTNDVWASYTIEPGTPEVEVPVAVPGVYPDWDSSVIYTGGEIVYHANEYWKAKWYNENVEPSVDNPNGPWGLYME